MGNHAGFSLSLTHSHVLVQPLALSSSHSRLLAQNHFSCMHLSLSLVRSQISNNKRANIPLIMLLFFSSKEPVFPHAPNHHPHTPHPHPSLSPPLVSFTPTEQTETGPFPLSCNSTNGHHAHLFVPSDARCSHARQAGWLKIVDHSNKVKIKLIHAGAGSRQRI